MYYLGYSSHLEMLNCMLIESGFFKSTHFEEFRFILAVLMWVLCVIFESRCFPMEVIRLNVQTVLESCNPAVFSETTVKRHTIKLNDMCYNMYVFNASHTVCCMHGLSIYEIKKIFTNLKLSISHMKVSVFEIHVPVSLINTYSSIAKYQAKNTSYKLFASRTCDDPEMLVRGGPTLTTFF